MNRQQSEHILDAYVRIRMRGGDEEAADALREVILDAMCGYSVIKNPGITLPNGGINYPYATWVDTDKYGPPYIVTSHSESTAGSINAGGAK